MGDSTCQAELCSHPQNWYVGIAQRVHVRLRSQVHSMQVWTHRTNSRRLNVTLTTAFTSTIPMIWLKCALYLAQSMTTGCPLQIAKHMTALRMPMVRSEPTALSSAVNFYCHGLPLGFPLFSSFKIDSFFTLSIKGQWSTAGDWVADIPHEQQNTPGCQYQYWIYYKYFYPGWNRLH